MARVADETAVVRTDIHDAVRIALVTALTLSLLLVPGLVPRAGASEAPVTGVGTDRPGVVATEETWQLPAGARNDAMWLWPEEHRAILRTPTGVVSVDLETGDEVARTDVDPVPWYSRGPNGASHMAAGREHTMALDRSTGRLYLPYIRRLRGNDTWLPFSLDTGIPDHAVKQVTEQQLCVSAQQLHSGGGCVGGYHVIDARTLEVVDTVKLENVRLDFGSGVAPILRVIMHAPPQGDETAGGKLHLLLEDMVSQAELNFVFSSAFTRGYGQTSILRLLQVDADTGRVDWTTRIEACRGTRDDHSELQLALSTMTNAWPTVALRSSDPSDRAIYVGCNTGGSRQAVVVRVPLDADGNAAVYPVTVDAGPPESPDGSSEPAPPSTAPAPPIGTDMRQQPFPGPEYGLEFRADPVSNRLLVRSNRSSTELWWVFDPKERAYIGAIGIGTYAQTGPQGSLDPVTGRFYLASGSSWRSEERLFVADIRRTPVAQALVFPSEWSHVFADGATRTDGPRRLYAVSGNTIRVLHDHLPLDQADLHFDIEGTTVDIPEADGVTAVSYDGSARGYGARMLMVGGIQGSSRVGPVDTMTNAHSYYNRWVAGSGAAKVPGWNQCLSPNREIVLAFVGPDSSVSMNPGNARGSVQPLVVDPNTANDGEQVDRCAPMDWEQVWTHALFGAPPVDKPTGVPSWVWGSRVSCVSGSEESWEDEATGALAAEVACGEQEASGMGQARGFQLGDLSISEAVSSFRMYRDAIRGLVSRVESVARGVEIGGVLRIDTVRGVAESWANGRRQPITAEDAPEGYAPGCDFDRSAGTCFSRHLFGLWTPAYSCGPCGDEDALIDGIDRALGTEAVVRFREPDARLARGADSGYMAAIVKRDAERYSDLMMNEDLLQTTLPTLEMVRFAPSTMYGYPGVGDPKTFPPRGRQIIQLAGVEVSSTYAIECLLHYDPATGICAELPDVPGSIAVSLADADGEPLAGGSFEVRRDTDGDGVVGLMDELVGDGACATAADGIGTCTFEGLASGSYLVSQITAPPGYAAVTEPWLSQLAPGEVRTVTFTNVSDISIVDITAVDAAGAPVADAEFAVYPDPDADGTLGDGAEPVATCVTGGDGTCSLQVPAGSYVLVQTAAPAGTEPIEPVAFAFATGGQTAAVGVVNEPVAPSAPSPPEPVAAPVPTYSQPVAFVAPVESTRPATPADAPAAAPVAESLGGTVVQVIRAPGDALRLLAREPKQAVAWIAALLLFGLAATAVRRRATLAELTVVPALGTVPPAGGGGPAPRAGSGRQAPMATGAMMAAVATSVAEPLVVGLPSMVAGASPGRVERASATVLVATSSPVLAALVGTRLAEADRIELLAVVDSVGALRAGLVERSPDIVIVDLGMAVEGDGDLCELLVRLHPPARTLGLLPQGRSLQTLVARGYLAGFGGMLAADEDLTNGQLAYAVRCLAADKPCYGPTVQALILEDVDARDARKPWRIAGLSGREIEVARLLAEGLSRSEIAQRLFLSEETIKSHIRAARAKLGVAASSDRAQLRRRLAEFGLLEEPPHA